MKKKLLFIILFAFFNCAGEIGHIKFYHFNMTKKELENKILLLMKIHPELQIPKTSKFTYASDDFSWTCYIKDKNGAEVFSYSFVGTKEDWEKDKKVTIALIAMAKYGEYLDYNKSRYFWEENRMIEKFENHFVNLIK